VTAGCEGNSAALATAALPRKAEPATDRPIAALAKERVNENIAVLSFHWLESSDVEELVGSKKVPLKVPVVELMLPYTILA
jgi:hypothetical protein